MLNLLINFLSGVQNEVCSARKEAELVRQKLWHVEADLTATRCRNSQLLEQMEAKTGNIFYLLIHYRQHIQSV